ncbi:uncharacterized protein LOC141911331 [Tubulanus polymorphus]|uniref:uncharacterized protein LOC141911331 n=1 Tax=Tubulanus polymorphus TaxID=672921 RepID=UPI003DA4310B
MNQALSYNGAYVCPDRVSCEGSHCQDIRFDCQWAEYDSESKTKTTKKNMYKTLFIALALFMVIGAIAAEEVKVVKKREHTCMCNGKSGKYSMKGGSGCCKTFGYCCPN